MVLHSKIETTRFAPSPTGRLHLGHAYAALFAAQAAGPNGKFLLRLEDLDQGRCRPEFEAQIYDDLTWLGLQWVLPVRRQSEHSEDYQVALRRLDQQKVLYPCFCTRKDIAAEIAAAGGAPQGPEGPLYPGLCRNLSTKEVKEKMAAEKPYALRLNAAKAVPIVGSLSFYDKGMGNITVNPMLLGDAVLSRKDAGASYHLAVVVDDALQGVTLVTRGKDLLPSTHLHRLLQALLGLPVPAWHHHRLIEDEAGLRLAKRSDALSLEQLRQQGVTPADIRRQFGFSDSP
ncbi:MAG: tRNA glutamyl-Q(34) synthetase GluQRS [Alphaproteobacteria bacterium]